MYIGFGNMCLSHHSAFLVSFHRYSTSGLIYERLLNFIPAAEDSISFQLSSRLLTLIPYQLCEVSWPPWSSHLATSLELTWPSSHL